MNRLSGSCIVMLSAALLMLPTYLLGAINGTVSPDSVDQQMDTGGAMVLTFDYSINVSGEIGGKADVMLLTDTTGSMGGYIYGIRTAFQGIVTTVSAALPGVDIRWCVADYRNYTDGGSYALNGLTLRQPFTSNTAAAQAAINTLYAGGGADAPESQLKAMVNLATNWTSPAGALGFAGRADAQKIVIWAGDVAGHHAGDEPYSSGSPPAGYYPTLSGAIASLNAQGIKVFGLNTMGAGSGIDQAYDGDPRQATTITSQTGGQLFNSISGSSSSVTNAIVGAIIPGVETLTNITMNVVGVDPDFTVTPLTQTIVGSWTSANSPVTGSFNILVEAPSLEGAMTDFEVVLLGNGAALDASVVSLRTRSAGPVAVLIDVWPFNSASANTVYLRLPTRKVPVYLLGSSAFDVAQVNAATVRFGKTGTEASLCTVPRMTDYNRDGVPDLMCEFRTGDCGFAAGDVVGILKGQLLDGTDIEGQDSVKIVP